MTDSYYTKTLKLLDAAQTALAGNETNKALGFLIEAVRTTTLGWYAEEYEDEEDPEPPSPKRPPIPSLRTLMIQDKNCVSALNEYAQKTGVSIPEYEFTGSGTFFRCTCRFDNLNADSEKEHRTKNEAKHDAAERMLDMLRTMR